MSPGPVRPLSALVLFFLLAPFAFPQNTRLPYRPIAAQWALNRIVMVSTGPNQLHLFDPATHTTESIALNAAPVSLSISPNGLFAAVGHAGSASYVNLTTRLVTRTYTYPTSPFPPAEVILGADTLYVLPKAGSAYPYAIRLDTGSDTTPGYYTASGASLHPNGSAIFAMSESERPGNVLRLATEPPGILQPPQTVTPAAGDFCGQVWYSPNGARLYSRCGSTATFPPAPQEPLSFAGRFSPTPVQAFAESLTQRIAFVPATADSANQILLLNSTNYAEIGRLALPTFTTGGRTFQGQGRHLFFQLDANGATSLTAIYQADPASGILNDFAIHTYALSPPAICTATFSAAALSIPSEGALRTVNVQAAPECVYSAASSASWVQIVSGGTGSGNSALRLHIQANTASQARTATVTLGPQSLTITQAAAPATIPAQFSLSYDVIDAAYSRPLDRIILVTSSPDELHLLDPVTGSDQFVNLPYPPQSVGLSPDGLKAAVGHAGFVSLVHLQGRALDRVVPSSLDSHAVLLPAEPWLYTMSTRGGRLLNTFTHAARSLPAFSVNAADTFFRPHASPNFAYTGYPPLYRLNIDGTDPAVTPIGISTPCPAFWSSQDATRLFNACGAVLRSSSNPNEDGTLLSGTLSGLSGGKPAAWITHSTVRQLTAALVPAAADPEIQLYGDDLLPLLHRIPLTPRPGDTPLATRGRWLFWNQAADKLYAITQLDIARITLPASTPLAEFAIETVPVLSLNPCTYSINPTNLSALAGQTTSTIVVQTQPACPWTAVLTQDWLSFTVNNAPVRFYSGSGPGSLNVVAETYAGNVARTANFTVAGISLTLTQSPPTPINVSPLSISSPATGTNAGILVASTGAAWNAVSNVPWITILSGGNFSTGSGIVGIRVDPNGGEPRTGTITVGTRTVTVTQASGTLLSGMRFVPVTPCRVADTRGATGETGPFGPPLLAAATSRDFPIPSGRCAIPADAAAYSVNVTVVPSGPLSYLTLWPTGQPRPLVSTLNSFDGRIKANAAIVPAGTNGAIAAYATDATHLILDV
ncbi:MAG: BACON domain-containing protein, partial [Bryobacterales bacterium]|nr:BACON domain-containing protein [Bryobacterales bacterium]